MRYFVRVRDNPSAPNYMQPLSLHRFSEDGKVAEFWDRETEAWKDAPGIIAFTGIGGDSDAFEVDEAMAFNTFLERFGGDEEAAKAALEIDYVPIVPVPQAAQPEAAAAPEQAAPKPEAEVRGALRRLHYGPGEHPGTGTDQTIHAGEDDGLAGDYPKAGERVSGLFVRDEVPNTSSISASLYKYEVLPDIRELPMADFPAITGQNYNAVENERVAELQREIEASGEITPLIVVMEKAGPYILEGSHRIDALFNLGKATFPALVVISHDD